MFFGMVVSVLLCMQESLHYRQCCEPRMFIPAPDFFLSRFSDPKNMRGKKNSGLTCFCSLEFHKIVLKILFFNRANKYHGLGIRDLRSEKKLFRIQDPNLGVN
jgi:hypothetical protein